MQLFDSFASVGQQFNDFNKGIAEAIRKVDNFNTHMQGVADDINQSLKTMPNLFTDIVDSIDRLNSTMTAKNSGVMGFLANFNTLAYAVGNVNSIFDSLTKAVNTSAEAQGRKGQMKADTASKFAALTGATNAQTAALGGYKVKTVIATGVTTLFKLALKAIPFVAIAVAVGALIQGLTRLISSFMDGRREAKQQAEAVNEIRSSNDDLINSTEALTTSLQAGAARRAAAHQDELTRIDNRTNKQKSLLSSIEELQNAEEKTAEDRKRMAAYVEALNESMYGLNLQYDKETGLLNQSIAGIEKQIAARNKQARAAAAQERAVEIAYDQIRAYEKLNKITAEYEEIARKLEEGENLRAETIRALEEEKGRLADASEELTRKYGKLSDEYAEVTQKIYELNEAMEAAAYASEALAKAQQYALGLLADEYRNLKGTATDMFNTLSRESETSVADMISNLRHNQEVMGEWADNMKALTALAGEGIYSGLIEHFRSMGVDGAAYVRALVEGCRYELQLLSDYFENGAQVSIDTMATVWGLDEDVAKAAAELGRGAANSLIDALEAADFNNIGRSIADAVANAVKEGTTDVASATEYMASETEKVARRTLEVNSPSQVFYRIGEGVGQGFLNGIDIMSGAIQKVSNWGTQLIQTATQDSTNLVNNVITTLTPLPNKMDSTIQPAINNVIQWGQQVTQKGRQGIENMRQSILNTAQSIPNEMQNIGNNIVQGVWTGIQNASSHFTRNVQNFFGGIVRNAKSALGINSPSSACRLCFV